MLNDLSLPTDFNNPISLLKKLKTKREEYWLKKGDKRVLMLFREVVSRVPAYKDFLEKNGVDPLKIRTIKDFKKLPVVDKDNYLKAYPLEKLCWDGNLKSTRWVFSTTSGSTGEPFYFPRQDGQDQQYAVTAECYLRSNFNIHDKSVLYIDGFAMGAWIGGVFTYQAIKMLSTSGDYKISIITPGIFKNEIIKAVKNLGHKFDKVIIGGYPPMIKDTVDDGIKEGLNWKEYNIGFIFSAEGFSEKFRDYIIKKTGLKNPYKDTLNHYGTVDLGTMAHETPMSILIRRLLNKYNKNCLVFPEKDRQPTLAQFTPELFYFEEVENNGLLCSGFSGIPLVRYDLKDYGGVITLNQMKNKFKEKGMDLDNEIKKAGISTTVWNLPFVYVYERSDFTVKLYGANIYPDTIRKVLCEDEFEEMLTGKFTMLIDFDKRQNQQLVINIELKNGIMEVVGLKKMMQEKLIERLLLENSEFRSNYKEAPKKQVPKIIFWPYEHPQYFRPGGKQKWVQK